MRYEEPFLSTCRMYPHRRGTRTKRDTDAAAARGMCWFRGRPRFSVSMIEVEARIARQLDRGGAGTPMKKPCSGAAPQASLEGLRAHGVFSACSVSGGCVRLCGREITPYSSRILDIAADDIVGAVLRPSRACANRGATNCGYWRKRPRSHATDVVARQHLRDGEDRADNQSSIRRFDGSGKPEPMRMEMLSTPCLYQ